MTPCGPSFTYERTCKGLCADQSANGSPSYSCACDVGRISPDIPKPGVTSDIGFFVGLGSETG